MRLTSRKNCSAFTERQRKLSALRWCCFVVCASWLLGNLFTLTVRGQAEAGISGVVRDKDRAGVVGAEVTLGAGKRIIARTTTNDDGGFLLPAPAITESALTLEVRAPGFEVYRQAFNLSVSRRRGPWEIILTPATLAEEVTVIAARSPTRLNDTAASVIVLTPAELAATAALTLDERLRQVPGFSLFRRSSSRFANPTAQGVSLRGTGASGASRALVLADGVPLTDPFGGWVYWGRVPRASVGRLEVMRGAASDLYGSGALGGIVSIETRETKTTALSLEASLGSQTTGDASMWLGGRRGPWGASLAAEVFRTDGYILVAERERGAVDARAASHRRSGELMLERFFGNDIAKETRLFVRAATYGEERNNGTPLQTNGTRIGSFGAGAVGHVPFVGAYALRAYGGTQTYDQIFTAIAENRNRETLTRAQRVPAQVFGVSAQTSHAFGSRHTFVAGFEAREVRGASDEVIYQQERPASLVGAGGRERTIGFYASDLMRVGQRLILTGGLRFDRWRNYRALSATRALASSLTNTTEFPERSERAFSPRASALFQLNANVSLVASLARSFRQPTLNELYRAFRVGNVLTLANANLTAERLTGGEAGANFSFLERRFSARALLFFNAMTRPVANVTLDTTPTLITRQRQNLGRTRSRGFEVEAEARLSNAFVLSGGYLLADARVTDFPPNRALENLLLPQVARHQLTVQARYTNPSRWTVGLQGRFASRQFDDDQNQFPLRRYFTLDALVSYPLTSHLDAFIAGENLTNTRFEIGRTPVLTVGPPLSLRFGLRFNFGRD